MTIKSRATYRAAQVVSPGKWELTSKPMVGPPFGHVRIRVEACGVCHSDSATVDGLFPIEWPRVPGHEVVGRIDALLSGVQGWAVGQRVGVGFLLSEFDSSNAWKRTGTGQGWSGSRGNPSTNRLNR